MSSKSDSDTDLNRCETGGTKGQMESAASNEQKIFIRAVELSKTANYDVVVSYICIHTYVCSYT